MLAASPWGDPGGETPRAVAAGPAARLGGTARRVRARRAPWALGGSALLVARELFVARRRLPDVAAASARRLLGAAALDRRPSRSWPGASPRRRAGPSPERRPGGSVAGRGPLVGRVDRDGFALLRRPRFGLEAAVGAVGAAGRRRLAGRGRAGVAARGGGVLEVFDALA